VPEFAALLEDGPVTLSGIFDLVKGGIKMRLSMPSFPKLALLLSITGLVAGLLISLLVTPRYVSTATMRLSVAEVSASPQAVHRNLHEYLLQMQNEVLSRTSLSGIIQRPRLELYPSERARIPLEDVIEKMRKEEIQIVPEASAGTDYLPFQISFTYDDAVKAQDTVHALINQFQEANLASQRNQARVKREITSDQIYRMEARIAALERRLGMPSAGHEPDYSSIPSVGLNLDVLDPPSLPVRAVYPDRFRFMETGFGAGIVAALVIAVFRRRLPPAPLPAQSA
jgi:uncharacterized protein involved in exopolysaccharide biosynthesis